MENPNIKTYVYILACAHVCLTLTCLMGEYLLLISYREAKLYNHIPIQMKNVYPCCYGDDN